ncbi:hypothetical protein M0R04_09200 [Candidatus Dojkabacteria bacterium]|jgi:hypothetical protein|nr:hypothetical protein [Candidatus Dojkabacteria bacterium]
MLHITILNDSTGTKEVGNYIYKVFVNKEQIDEGVVKGHIRKNPWYELVDLIVCDVLDRNYERMWGIADGE